MECGALTIRTELFRESRVDGHQPAEFVLIGNAPSSANHNRDDLTVKRIVSILDYNYSDTGWRFWYRNILTDTNTMLTEAIRDHPNAEVVVCWGQKD